MKDIFEFIDHIFFINLDHRVDRKQHCEEQLKKIDPDLSHTTRLSGIIHKDKRGKIDGALGCCMSHIKCAEIAKEKGYKRFMVCEDDFFWNKDVSRILLHLDSFQQKVSNEDWFMFLLGTYERFDYKLHTDDIYKVLHSLSCTAYIVNDTCLYDWISIGEMNIKKWIEKKKGWYVNIDHLWLGYQKSGKIFTCNTEDYRLVKQISGYSDIAQCDREITW